MLPQRCSQPSCRPPQIACESKRIHIDLCRNERGEFFKLSEIDNTGKRNKVFFPVSGARVMADTFDEFAECDEGYGDTVPTATLDAEGFPQVRDVLLRII